jgi:uncharacterized membrane protein
MTIAQSASSGDTTLCTISPGDYCSNSMDELTAIPIIAQGAGAIPSILVWSIGLIFLVLLLFGAVAWLRRHFSPTRQSSPVGFSLSDLRSLRQKGAISDEEFERAKAKLLQELKIPIGDPGKPGKSPGGPDAT